MKQILTALLLISTTFIIAQHPHCMTFEKTMEMKAADPLLGEQIRIAKNQIDAYYNDPANFSSRQGIITIPVVFHVMHNGEPIGTLPNVSDAQLISQITQLNKDYRKLNSDTNLVPNVWKNIAADCQIEFCLASVDPSGAFTSGITRHSMGASGTWSDARKTTTTWDRNRYLNIWIATFGGGTLGYTMIPGGPADQDGVVIDPLYIGVGGSSSTPFNKGRTASHEIGHWLGLDHTWGDDGTACTGTDGIEDTPNQSSENYGCPTFPQLDACSPASPGVMYMDYMDYTDDACMFMFTKAQKNKMLSVLNTVRSSIKTSNGCGTIGTITISGTVIDATSSSPVANASIMFEGSVNRETVTDASGNFSVNINAGSYNVYAGKWGYMTNRFSYNQAYSTSSSGVTIPLESGKYYDDFSINQNWLVSGTAASSGSWVIAYPVETRSASGNTITQTGHSLTTDFGSRCYVTGNGTYGASANSNDVDAGSTILTSPVMDLSMYHNPYIEYHKWFYGSVSDNEKFSISNGSSKSDIETVIFSGSENVWTTKKIRVLDLITLTNNMTFSVEVTDAGSASTVEGALDKFVVFDSVQANIQDQNQYDLFNVFPNPAKNEINIVFAATSNQPSNLKIYNMYGDLVLTESIQPNNNYNFSKIDISGFSNGIYMIELSDNEHISIKKIVKQ